MTNAERTASDEARIRETIADWVAAIHAKDVDRVMSFYMPDVVQFDLSPPLEHAGAKAIRQILEGWFPTFRGPVGYEVSKLHVSVVDDLAYCRSLNRITGTRTGGEKTDVWLRATLGLRKVDGKWRIAHEHASVPFYMDGSYKAAVDLKP
jgi:uncharacterized protein (TIGR02246 family)